MSESIGEQLRKARQARGWSLEQVAHATCIRPDKLTALEEDDYSAFPSPAYSRGFLTMYGKYVGVDVSAEARTMEGHSALHIIDYQYLKNVPVRQLPEDSVAPRERTPSVVPLLVFGGILILAVAIIWLLMTVRRLGLA
jgi:cytoskeletal protein RodZ